jgi:hypothetical protein
MFKLTSLLGTALSSKEKPKEVSERTYTIVNDMYQKINAKEPFSLVYIEVLRKNGQLIGDPKYICNLVEGKMVTPRNIGVIVPFGKAGQVYKKLDQLAGAPFRSELRAGHVSYTGSVEEHKDIIHDLLVEAQMHKLRRTYAGKHPPQSLGEKALECA